MDSFYSLTVKLQNLKVAWSEGTDGTKQANHSSCRRESNVQLKSKLWSRFSEGSVVMKFVSA